MSDDSNCNDDEEVAYMSNQEEDSSEDEPNDDDDDEDDNYVVKESECNEQKVSHASFYNPDQSHYETRRMSTTTTTSEDSDGNESPPQKKAKQDFMDINPKISRIMGNMGYNREKGLGKSEQGIINPIEASRQKGRRGIGFEIPGLSAAGLTYDPDMEVINTREDVEWLSSGWRPCLTREINQWTRRGKRMETIENATEFCDPAILEQILQNKTVFDKLDDRELREARNRSNPFETIRGGIFLNRAAMKMANMDALLDFMFTNPKDENGIPIVNSNELLYFADVCAGPGGFSEYILWRKKWKAKGFGFTLKGDNDFKLDDFLAAPSETFEPFYGYYEDGDVYKRENIGSLQGFIMDRTNDKGVHFMMADGGFSVDGKENIQEILSKRLYLCQCLVALLIVRTGGHFVVKLFDIFTRFSVGLVYLMFRCFREITIIKPNTSRPANSERYLVCKHKLEGFSDVASYLSRTNMEIDKLSKPDVNEDINEIVPLDILLGDEEFFNYIFKSNNTLGKQQIVSLAKVAAYAENSSLYEANKYELRKECLKLWNIPDEPRKNSISYTPDERALSLLNCRKDNLTMSIKFPDINKEFLGQLKHKGIWQCCPVTRKPTYFLGLGGNKVYEFNGDDGKWYKVNGVEFVKTTLVIGEMVKEFEGVGKGQRHQNYLYIIDVQHIYDDRLGHLPFHERREWAKLYCQAIAKTGNLVKFKEMLPCDEIPEFLQNEIGIMDFKNKRALGMAIATNIFVQPIGLLFYNASCYPWIRVYSKTSDQFYYFNTKDRDTKFYEKDKDKYSGEKLSVDVMESVQNSYLWNWDGYNFHTEKSPPDKVSFTNLCRFLTGGFEQK